MTPPPTSQANRLLLVDNRLGVVNSTWVLMTPRPVSTYGWITPTFGENITLPMNEKTLDVAFGPSPKKLSMKLSSNSLPTTLPMEPIETPRLRVLLSHEEISGQ